MNLSQIRENFKLTSKGCLEWKGAKYKSGYGAVRFNGKVQRVHRVIWELMVGKIPKGVDILHTCDNPPCACIDHLFKGTQAVNMKDKVEKGRQPQGEKHRDHILTEAQAVEVIEKKRASGGKFRWGASELAEKFGVKLQTVSGIANGRTWKHVRRSK